MRKLYCSYKAVLLPYFLNNITRNLSFLISSITNQSTDTIPFLIIAWPPNLEWIHTQVPLPASPHLPNSMITVLAPYQQSADMISKKYVLLVPLFYGQ